jgi:hypothetical protein
MALFFVLAETDPIVQDPSTAAPGLNQAADHREEYRIKAYGSSSESRHLSKEALKAVYDLPIEAAAARLGVGVTVLKKYCRKFDIIRWPYRKRLSVHKLLGVVKEYAATTAGADHDTQPLVDELE